MTETLTADGTTLGVVGGGQLGRMLAEAASPLGVDVVVLDPTPDCPAAGPAEQIEGDFDDVGALRELAERSDALTYEIELADADLLALTESQTGTDVHPRPDTLSATQDKLVEKRELLRHDVPVPEFRKVEGEADLETALDHLGAPVMVKARQGGYDGRGNAPVSSVAEAHEAFGEDLDGLLAEELVDFERELSVIGVQGDGESDTFPVVENVHEEEILRTTVAPARTTTPVRERAREVARDVLDVLWGRGVYGIELFETADGEILVNEIAPRPHNSGHYTIEGAVTSQFEQHVRAVLGLPLGSTALRDPTVMVNLLGDVEAARPAELRGVGAIYRARDAHLHWYGKREARPLRKMGHVTLTGGADTSRMELLDRARDLREAVTFRP